MARRRTGYGDLFAGGNAEWVGGRLPAPFYVTEDGPERPDIVLWLEQPEGVIVGTEVVPSSAPAAVVGEVLAQAMESPMIGPPRRPARIRVNDARLIDVLAPLVGGPQRVRVAPTPELQEVVAHLARSMAVDTGGKAASYFEGGRVSESVVADLFAAAAALYRLAPWQYGPEIDVLRVDLPHLQIEGACLSIIGALGQSYGFLLFPSLQVCDTFCAGYAHHEDGDPVDLGGECLALNFERGADLPAGLRREVSEHRWPVAGPAAYPMVTCRDRDGLLRPLTERDVRIAADVAGALAAFCATHGARIADPAFGPVSESFRDDRGGTVRLTLPHDGPGTVFDLREPAHDFAPPRGAAPRVGRNDPCPCGSGKKYKKCHLGAPLPETGDAAPPEGPEDRAAPERARVVGAILDFALAELGTDWLQPMRGLMEDPQLMANLGTSWWAFHATVDGRPLAAHFLAAGGDRLSADMRAWIASQMAAWLSIWEVTAIERGRSVELTDLLTGERRTVADVLASQTLQRRDAILARVVDHDGTATLWGVAPNPLPPLEAEEIARLVRRRLRVRGAVPIERLRDEAMGPYLIRRWQRAVEALAQQAAAPARLQNTSGDPLLFTTDHFTVAPGARADVARALEACGAMPGTRDGDFVFHAGAERTGLGETLTATARLTDDTLAVETNSRERADAHRARIEAACGPLIRHRIREHTDPVAAANTGSSAPPPRAELDAAEKPRPTREIKERFYAKWIDEPLPLLGDRSPRAAARTAAGRRQVDLLLREIEHREARLPADEQMDFTIVRRALGLET